MLYLWFCFRTYQRRSNETGGGPAPEEPPNLNGDAFDGLPDIDRPLPSTCPLPGGHVVPGSGHPLPDTWPPRGHFHKPGFDPMKDYTGNHVSLPLPRKNVKVMHNKLSLANIGLDKFNF